MSLGEWPEHINHLTCTEFVNNKTIGSSWWIYKLCLYLTCNTKAGFAPGHLPHKNEQIQTTQVWTSCCSQQIFLAYEEKLKKNICNTKKPLRSAGDISSISCDLNSWNKVVFYKLQSYVFQGVWNKAWLSSGCSKKVTLIL